MGQETKTNLILKQIVAGINGLSPLAVNDTKYQTSDIDSFVTFGDSYLIGQVESTGTGIWLIKRLKQVTDSWVFTYATIENNSSKTTYAAAWTDRLNLIYGSVEGLTIP